MSDGSFALSGVKLGVGIENSMKRTYVTRASTAPLTIHQRHSSTASALQQRAEEQDLMDSINRTRATTPASVAAGSQDMSQSTVLSAQRNQREAKEAMETIVQQSQSPGVIRLYSASIKQDPTDHNLFSPAVSAAATLFARDRRRRTKSHQSAGPCSNGGKKISDDPKIRAVQLDRQKRGQSEALKSTKKILALAAKRGELPKIEVAERAASKLVIDNRPKPPGAIPMYEKRITNTGAPVEEKAEVMPFPRSPFDLASCKAQPEWVYPPKRIPQTLEMCQPGRKHNTNVVTDEERYAAGVIDQPEYQDDDSDFGTTAKTTRLSPERRSPRRKRFASPDHVTDRPLPPPEVRATLASRESVPQSIAPQHTKGAERAMRQSHKDSTAPTRATLASRERIVKVKAQMQFRMAVQGGAQTPNSTSLPSPMAAGGRGAKQLPLMDSIVAEHRGKIVKSMYNRI